MTENIMLLALICGITVLLVVLAVLMPRLLHKHENSVYLRSTLADLDHAKGEQFERYLLAFFERQGYRGHMTEKSHDYGADLVLHKNGETTIVQAKRYRGKVGIAAVQQIVGAKSYYHADHMIVATNAYFSAPAKKLAKANHVRLMDRETFLHETGEKKIAI